MKIAVLGCGAIGGFFLGSLTKAGFDVLGVVRSYQKEKLDSQGLILETRTESELVKVKTVERLESPVDLAIFATKINDLKQTINDNYKYLQQAMVFSTQNGIRADYILRDFFAEDKIITGIVMFGSTFYPPNKVVFNFPGDVALGNIFDKIDNVNKVAEVLSKCFGVVNIGNIKGAKYLKIFVNLNNCIPAILGVCMQEAFKDLDVSRIAININREAFSVVRESGIILEDLPAYPVERLVGLVSMEPTQAAGLFSQIMTSLSKEPLYGSILQSIQRNKPSEIDYINGEIVSLARDMGQEARLNQKIVDLVHKVENNKQFIPKKEFITLMSS